MNKVVVIAEKILFGAVLAAAAMPLVVVYGFAHPFITPRELVLRIIAAVALPALGILVYCQRRRPKMSLMGWAVILLWLAQLLAVIFSVEPAVSFWGFAERLSGFLSISLYVVCGISLWLIFKKPTRRRIFVLIWAGVWSAVAVFAVGERLGLIPLWQQFHGEGARVVATIGNPIFLANALLVAYSSIAVGLFLLKRSKWRDLFFIFLSIIFAAALLFTETRGAYLAAVAGLVIAATLIFVWSKNKLLRITAISAPLIVLALLVGLWPFRHQQFVQENFFLNRVYSIFQTTDASRVQRFQLWQIAAKAAAERPIFGWGQETFDTALDRLYPPDFTRYGTANSFSDRAHNSFLDIAATAGLVGLTAYLLLFFALIRNIYRLKNNGVLTSTAAIAALSAIGAYLVSGLTSFESQMSYLGLAVLTAFVSSAGREESAPLTIEKPSRGAMSAIALGSLALSGLLIYYGVVPLYRGALLVHRAIVGESGADLFAAAKEIQTFYNPYRAAEEHRIANEIFKAVGNKIKRGEPALELLKEAEKLAADAVGRRPNNFAVRFTLGNILLLEAVRGAGSFDQAREVFEQARLLAPRRQMIDYQLGNLYLVQKKFDDAEQTLRRALELDRSVAESHWHLGRALAENKKDKEAVEEFKAALNGTYTPSVSQEYALAVNAAIAAGELDVVGLLYERWVTVEPEEANVWAGLAAARAELGDKAGALQAVKKAVALDPTIQSEVPAFLKKYDIMISE